MKRYDLIDTLRGFSIISMIAFHTCWLLNFFGLAISDEMLYGTGFLVWERTICIGFISISGFSFSFGHRHIRMGIKLLLIGAIITFITCLVIPKSPIIFGILTFLGSATLIMIPVDKIYRKASNLDDVSEPVNALLLAASFIFFVFTYNINRGYLGFASISSVDLPKELYSGYISTFIGFMKPGFVSSDYFSLLPWIFIYISGYFLHKAVMGSPGAERVLSHGVRQIAFLGRHSLIIYLLHPVAIFLILYLVRYCA